MGGLSRAGLFGRAERQPFFKKIRNDNVWSVCPAKDP